MGFVKQVGNSLQGAFCQVDTSCIDLVLFFQEILVFQLSLDLVSGSNEGHSIDAGHDRLFYCFSLDVSLHFLGDLMVC